MAIPLSKKEIQDRICQLIYRAETFLNWSSLLLNLYKKEWNSTNNSITKQNNFINDPANSCVTLHQVLYFQEAIIVLHSLLENKKHPVEISFKYYFANAEKRSLKKEVDIIREEYKATNLDKFRNRLIAHKQADSIGDPLIGYLNPVKKEYVEKACSIVNKLKSVSSNSFSFPANNYFGDFYTPGFEVLFEACKSSLDVD